ncbi:hypothetical protein [Thermomonospora umbrina]|uniref:Uncharacterized protein n=1 Tax=Thermomonospora umbrina TaxID=111806 RepID=A0A3D9SYL6_9ACTN|nr:hypothetical protein [Thermomonospora umbrina]REE96711.1 hypothetical protein DFJ69_2158 [Thermomonospora umbrina]
MTASRPARRRHLPTSPFKQQTAAPVEDYAVDDRVSHDKYGLGRVIAVEEGVAVIVDFSPTKRRITVPYEKLVKL